MTLYLLHESASGYALLHAHGLDEIGQNTEAVANSITDLNRFGKVVQLTAFHPFESALDALNQINAVSEGQLAKIKFQFLVIMVKNIFWVCSVCGSFDGFCAFYVCFVMVALMGMYCISCLD
jgi:nucleolar protein 56